MDFVLGGTEVLLPRCLRPRKRKTASPWIGAQDHIGWVDRPLEAEAGVKLTEICENGTNGNRGLRREGGRDQGRGVWDGDEGAERRGV